MFLHDSHKVGIMAFTLPRIEYSVQNRLAFSISGFSMAFNEALADRIRRRLARRKNIEEKKMFGGIVFMLNGNMLVGVWKESLIVRLGQDQGDEALLEPHVKEFDITGKPMKGWIKVAKEGVQEEAHVKAWIQRAMKFVGKLPPK
jgi:TfoX/Sxy family transcriptional regulator of competence genes